MSTLFINTIGLREVIMEWYYAEGQKQIGPISDDEFRSLVDNGTILSSTLVWNNSLTDWVPYDNLLFQ